jgi:hypothetical protein
MSITQIAAIYSAVLGLAGGAWLALDYTETRPVILKEFNEAQADSAEVMKGLLEQQTLMQKQLSTSVMELQFQTLDMKRKQAGHLEWSDHQNYCRIAKRLDYVNVEGCPNHD